MIATCKLSQVADPGRVIYKIVRIGVVIDSIEMLFGNFQIFVNPFPNSYTGYDDNELLEPIFLIQFKNRAEIHIGFTGAGLHFGCEIHSIDIMTTLQFGYTFNLIAFLNSTYILKDLRF